MKIYAINNDPKNLILVDKNLRVVNGSYTVHQNEDGTLSVEGFPWKAYYKMMAPAKDCDKALDLAEKMLADPNWEEAQAKMMTGG